MSTTTDNAKKVLGFAGQALEALEVIGAATEGLIASPGVTEEALAVLKGMSAVITSIQNGINGTVSVQTVQDAMTVLTSTIASNNAAVDAAANQKFGTGGPLPP